MGRTLNQHRRTFAQVSVEIWALTVQVNLDPRYWNSGLTHPGCFDFILDLGPLRVLWESGQKNYDKWVAEQNLANLSRTARDEAKIARARLRFSECRLVLERLIRDGVVKAEDADAKMLILMEASDNELGRIVRIIAEVGPNPNVKELAERGA